MPPVALSRAASTPRFPGRAGGNFFSTLCQRRYPACLLHVFIGARHQGHAGGRLYVARYARGLPAVQLERARCRSIVAARGAAAERGARAIDGRCESPLGATQAFRAAPRSLEPAAGGAERALEPAVSGRALRHRRLRELAEDAGRLAYLLPVPARTLPRAAEPALLTPCGRKLAHAHHPMGGGGIVYSTLNVAAAGEQYRPQTGDRRVRTSSDLCAPLPKPGRW